MARTGIFMYGIDSADFGDYTVTVDGRDVSFKSANGNRGSKKLLASAQGLNNGPHTATLVSSGSKAINLDYMDVQHEAPGSSMSTAVIDDNDPRVTYQPSSAWNVNNGNDFMNNTLHFSQTNGSSASLTFTGQAIAVYGTVSFDHANVQVTLDGQSKSFPANLGPTKSSSLHTQVLWYFAEALGPGQHSLSMISDVQQGTGPFIDVDAFVVYTFNGANDSVDDSSNSSSGSRSNSVPKAAIIGASVGGGVVLIVLLVLLILFLRRRNGRKSRGEANSPTTPVLPFQTSQRPESPFPAVPFPPPFVKSHRSSDQHSIAPSYYGSNLQPGVYNHSRADSATSGASSTVPILGIPKPPSSLRSTSPAGSDMGAPIRPSRPPGPVLDLDT
ncbi:hypothetical protein V5O48_003711 [Marasmius crinis-equi]|uniref:Transmembrane protein n=1 Tax=Marasmius crinis-equi TaxID=585013 RepID=A0ABR3FS62_9AGAR